MADQYSYFYNEQKKKYIRSFMRIFKEIAIKDNRGNTIDPVVRYGTGDKVFNAVINDRNTYPTLSFPIFACYITGEEMDKNIQLSRRHADTTVYRTSDGSENKVMNRLMPVRYNYTFNVDIAASNKNSLFQIIEQIQLLCRPDIKVQVSEDIQDWASMAKYTLQSIQSEPEYTLLTDNRDTPQATLEFTCTANILFPVRSYGTEVTTIYFNKDEDDAFTHQIDEDDNL